MPKSRPMWEPVIKPREPIEIPSLSVSIKGSIEDVWRYWTVSDHIRNWASLSMKWECTEVFNELELGGGFHWRMQSRDGKSAWYVRGTYEKIEEGKNIVHLDSEERLVRAGMEREGDTVVVTVSFSSKRDSGDMTFLGMWSFLLDNFKAYVES